MRGRVPFGQAVQHLGIHEPGGESIPPSPSTSSRQFSPLNWP